jgi:glycosyltransferase involved in cell wall biosynthesis
VSTVQYRKGQDLLVESLPQLSRRVSGIRLELVGNTINSTEWVLGSRDFKAALMRRLEELQLGDRVRFWGPRDDALDFIHAADVLLLPSRAEAMPLVVLEAMALGTPVVASGVDGVTELIEDGSTGLLFDPTRPADLVEAVDRIARDPDFARGLAKRGQERYWQEFNAKKLRDGYVAVVTQIGTVPESATSLDSPHTRPMDTVLASGRDRVVTADTVQDG